MTVEICNYIERPIKAKELMNLYNNVGWWEERKEQDIDKMLKQEGSVGAWKNDVLIGFARAVSDGKFRAYIEDVVIHKEFQKLGIGTKLVSVTETAILATIITNRANKKDAPNSASNITFIVFSLNVLVFPYVYPLYHLVQLRLRE